jgi:rubrerythrin
VLKEAINVRENLLTAVRANEEMRRELTAAVKEVERLERWLKAARTERHTAEQESRRLQKNADAFDAWLDKLRAGIDEWLEKLRAGTPAVAETYFCTGCQQTQTVTPCPVCPGPMGFGKHRKSEPESGVETDDGGDV